MTDKPDSELKELSASPQLVPVSPELKSGTNPTDEGTVAAKRFGLPEPGDVFAGRYKILAQLGSGGMSVVYQVRDQVLKKEVALKLLLPRGNRMDQANLRFQQEATTIARLDHANIVKVLDLSVSPEEIPYIVMELLPGKSLAEILTSESLHPARVIEIMLQACDSLSHAHANGIVHRDVKPSNFMLQDVHGDVKLKLLDFGVAKLLAADGESPKLTQTGETMGSPLYMSPEQCAGDKIDERSDIYSLGCVMYEAFSGSPPFMGATALNVILKHLNEQPLPVQQARMNQADVNSINAIVMKCLQKDPGDRYATVAAIKQDLQKLLRGDAVEYTFRPAPLDELESSPGISERVQLPVVSHCLRIYGFTQMQLFALMIAFIGALTLARMIPKHHGSGVEAVFIFIMVVSVVVALMKALELHRAVWWLHRFGMAVKLPPATLPEIGMLSASNEDLSASQLSPTYWKLSAWDLSRASPARKRQLSMLMANVLPDLDHMQFFYSNFSSTAAGSSHSDCYLISSASPAKKMRQDEAMAKLGERFQSGGLPLYAVSASEVRSLLFPLINPSHPERAGLPGPLPSPDVQLLPAPEQMVESLKIDQYFSATLTFTKLPAEISSQWYQNLLDLPCRLALSVHASPCDSKQAASAVQTAALMRVLQVSLQGSMQVPTTQPFDASVSYADMGIYVCVYADTLESLGNDVSLVKRAVANLGGTVEIAEGRQSDCFVSTMPFAQDRQKTVHRLPANAATALFPF